jgi:hypothetical protein
VPLVDHVDQSRTQQVILFIGARTMLHGRIEIARFRPKSCKTLRATDYNTERPHSALGYQTPAGFELHLTTAIVQSATRDDSSERQAIAQPAPKGVNGHRTPVAVG